MKRNDVITDLKDKYSQIPLSWAAKNGYNTVVQLLVKQDDIVADLKDKYNQYYK